MPDKAPQLNLKPTITKDNYCARHFPHAMHLQTTEYEPPKYAEPASYNTWEELPKYKVHVHATEVMLVLWRTCSPSAEGSCNTTMEASRTPKRTPVFCWRVELRRNASSRSAIHEIAIIKVSKTHVTCLCINACTILLCKEALRVLRTPRFWLAGEQVAGLPR